MQVDYSENEYKPSIPKLENYKNLLFPMQENHYQFLFPIVKIGNVSGHPVCNTHKIAARQTLGPTYSGKTLSSTLTTILPVVDT